MDGREIPVAFASFGMTDLAMLLMTAIEMLRPADALFEDVASIAEFVADETASIADLLFEEAAFLMEFLDEAAGMAADFLFRATASATEF